VVASREGEQLKALHTLDARALPSLFDTVLDRSGTGVMVFDDQVRIAYVNEVAARVGGYPADVHVGKRLSELYPQTGAQADPLIARVLQTGEGVYNEEVVWESPEPPHSRRFWMVSYVPLPTASSQQYVAAIYVETTEARRAHERLAKLIDALPTFVGMCTPDGILLEAN
jgi:PAS domain S-box-containing protein